jgi:toxin ParE1/3/4
MRALTRLPFGWAAAAGPPRDQLARGLRVMFQGNYALYYVVNESELVIVRVLHGARDAAAVAERGGFTAR